ncbi:MAG: conjugal transfer protein TraR [Candidatus Dormibacteraeota bacterium]|nr:conjugal transfer protein TraR [Candidatus Dormibacteraeota bacterium]
MLTWRELRRFRDRLEVERNEIEARIQARRLEIRETVDEESRGRDEAIRFYDQEVKNDLNAIDRETLAQINRALRRINEGNYGLSEVSGRPIPIERLEAVPFATTLADEQPLEPE